MSHLENLKTAKSLRELAVILGYSPKAVSYLLYIKPKAQLYSTFQIPKKSGGLRLISKPCDELHGLQKKVSIYLQDCMREIEEAKGEVSTVSHAFRRRHSIVTNALAHKGRRFVFNVDLHDFFGSINFGRVRGFFISDNKFRLDPAVATVLAQIVCHNNSLPQGSPSSPVISNLIGHILDVHLLKLASAEGCTYTRYADDLTFSTNKRDFPESISKLDSDGNWMAGDQLREIIKKCGFSLNEPKTRMSYLAAQKVVTGLVVNKKVNTKYSYRRYARSMAESLFRTGAFSFPITNAQGSVEQLCGIFSFIEMVAEKSRSFKAEHSHAGRRKNSGVVRTYSELLFYRRFYANTKPILIYEGKTDEVYLRSAIRSFAKKGLFPELAISDSQGNLEYKVDFFKYSKTTARILGLEGGADQLKIFISGYLDRFSRYSAPGNTNPVIVVIDNDSGSKEIYSLIKQLKKLAAPVDGMEEHYVIVKNLFVIPTPKAPGKQSKIEDFFDSRALGWKVGGKSFDVSNEYDSTTSYGKNTFAEEVVKKNQDSLDFSGFSELLNRVVNVINFYRP